MDEKVYTSTPSGPLTTRYNGDYLTGVYLVTNTDGTHTEKELIGYIDQHPFVVLHQLLPKYYVSGYGRDDIYPVYMNSNKYTLFLKNEGYSYNYINLDKKKIKNIKVFTQLYCEIMDLALIQDDDEEYLKLLGSCLRNNSDLQEAIDYQDIEINIEEKKNNSDISDNIANLIAYLSYYTYSRY